MYAMAPIILQRKSKKCHHYIARVTRVNKSDGPKNDSVSWTGPTGAQNNGISTFNTSTGSPNCIKQINTASSNSNVINTEDEDLDVGSPKFIKYLLQ